MIWRAVVRARTSLILSKNDNIGQKEMKRKAFLVSLRWRKVRKAAVARPLLVGVEWETAVYFVYLDCGFYYRYDQHC